MVGLLEPTIRQTVIGHAEVREVFDLTKKGKVAGCMATQGHITSRARVRVKRGGDTIYEGTLVSLKRFQNDAAEVHEGQECGMRLDNFDAYAPGDVLEFFEVEKIAQQL